ncbi:MAG TPA: HEAT repeat domain-containing protein [Phycisphaerae bacterium]|nr:HEAT repeat domain-containing protein [Phycisphaerae bacterium]
MRWYCPGCWRDFGEDLATCPHCRLDIHAFWDSKDYVEKLMLALNHPEPTTPVRAAELLGRVRAARAVEPLIRLVRENADIFVVRAAVRALALIGTTNARRFLETLGSHPAEWIRVEAAADLGRAASDHNPLPGDAK